MKDLKNKVAVITGAASGIGLGLAERFADAGMKLVLADIEEAPLMEVSKRLRAKGTPVLAQRLDVSKGAEMDALARQSVAEFGAVHVVCNNAGVAASGRLWELSEADWKFVLGANLWGVIHGLRVFTPLLLAQNEGHIVNTASMAGLVSVPTMGAYSASKHAVVTISETLFGELKLIEGNRVGVSVLCPSFVKTRIWESERNRPQALRDPEEQEPNPKLASARDMSRRLVEGGLSVAEVAKRVHEAVVEDEFYILTHEHTEGEFRQRAQKITDRGAPYITDPTTRIPGGR